MADMVRNQSGKPASSGLNASPSKPLRPVFKYSVGGEAVDGQVVRYTIKELKDRGCWCKKALDRREYNLYLADRGRIKYSKLTLGAPRKIVTNFLRGTMKICDKNKLLDNLRAYCELNGKDYTKLMPATYTIRSRNPDPVSTPLASKTVVEAVPEKEAKTSAEKSGETSGETSGEPSAISEKKKNLDGKSGENSAKMSARKVGKSRESWLEIRKRQAKAKKKQLTDERAMYLKKFESEAKSGESANAWIAKSSGGFKGKDIKVSNSAKKLLSFIDGLKGKWVIQKYIENPMLVDGRKFDIRTWHLITAFSEKPKLDMYLYDEGVLRVSSKRYSNSNFEDDFIHITNNAIQQNHPEYGKNEKDNLLDFHDFDKILKNHFRDKEVSVKKNVLPQINNIVMETLR
ncbi:hypothetical protein AAMO2058_000328400 [Amorphochlora amoebiformis]